MTGPTSIPPPRPVPVRRDLAVGAAVVTVLLWGSAFIGIRYAAASFRPVAVVGGVLCPAGVAVSRLRPRRRAAGGPADLTPPENATGPPG